MSTLNSITVYSMELTRKKVLLELQSQSIGHLLILSIQQKSPMHRDSCGLERCHF